MANKQHNWEFAFVSVGTATVDTCATCGAVRVRNGVNEMQYTDRYGQHTGLQEPECAETEVDT